jgi:hypothetical protein
MGISPWSTEIEANAHSGTDSATGTLYLHNWTRWSIPTTLTLKAHLPSIFTSTAPTSIHMHYNINLAFYTNDTYNSEQTKTRRLQYQPLLRYQLFNVLPDCGEPPHPCLYKAKYVH